MVAIKQAVVTLVLVLPVACTTTSPGTLPPVIDTEDRITAPDDRIGPGQPQHVPGRAKSRHLPPTNGAVLALLERADEFQRTGEAGQEAATIERALRIEPNNAALWHRLAAARLQQGQPQQAEQLALKSNSLSGGDKRLQALNWALVAEARWVTNDPDGASLAEEKMRQAKRDIK
jgi:tetratricopeptide (TPR) repeat protein